VVRRALRRAGVDYLSVSKGGRFEDAKQPRVGEAVYPYTGRSGYECMPTVLSDERGPFARNVRWPRASARPFTRPASTRPWSPAAASAPSSRPRASSSAARRLRRRRAPVAGRSDWFRKIRLGYGSLVRRCEFTNYCEGLDQQHKQ